MVYLHHQKTSEAQNLMKDAQRLYAEIHKNTERNESRLKQMKTYSMFVDQKSQYCKDVGSLQLIDRFNENPIKISGKYFF